LISKSNKITPQTTKKLLFGPPPLVLPSKWMKKLKLRRFGDDKLLKCPHGEKNINIKIMIKTTPF
jgi:hypothetical protein